MLISKALYEIGNHKRQIGAIEIFLSNAEVHEEVLRLFPILLRHPVFYSVFISYSHRDFEFAEKLNDRLQGVGVKVWRDEKEMSAGAGISETVKDAIARHDRVLLLFSRASLDSSWVEDEIGYVTMKEAELGGRQSYFHS